MRPGGLTALAVFNFIVGGIGGFVGLGRLAAKGANATSASLVLILLDLAGATLLITSGLGYLQRKRMLGRILGNGYAVIALASITLEVAAASNQFAITSLISFIYPLITLFLINVIFREDLVL